MARLDPAAIALGWRPLDEGQQSDALTLLDAAYAWIEERRAVADDDPIVKRVVLEVVRTALAPPADFTGATSYTDTMGPFSQSATLPTPAGTLVFTAAHASALGVSAQPVPVAQFGDAPGYGYPPRERVFRV